MYKRNIDTQQWGWPLYTMHNHSHRNIKTRINNTVNIWICRECLKVCRLRFEPPINERAVSLHTSCLSDHLSPPCHSNLTSQVFLRKGGKFSKHLKDAMCQRAGLFTLENVHAKFLLKFDYTHPLPHAMIKQHSWLTARWPIFSSKPVKRISPAWVWHS